MKAFIGTGLLGANFVRALIQKGETVQVWNRTASKAKALEAYGAIAFDDVEAAVIGAGTIHVTLKDDESVNEVLAQAVKGFSPGAVIIDHTTTSVKGAIERTHALQQQGYHYLHAPVFMGPQNALESTGYMLASGNQALIQQLEPALAAMTGKLINVGPQEGKAAGLKLTGNLFLLTMTAGISDTLALAKGFGIAPADILDLFSNWNPGAAMPARLKKIAEGNFSSPSWELAMARKDAGLMIAAAQENNVTLSLIPVIAGVMDQWLAKGHAQDDWSVIAKDNI